MGDPVFDPEGELYDLFNPRDPEPDLKLIAARRRLVLKHLNVLYQIIASHEERIKTLEHRLDELDETAAGHAWFSLRLLDALIKSDPEAAERINIDYEVNQVDPDFSFREALLVE